MEQRELERHYLHSLGIRSDALGVGLRETLRAVSEFVRTNGPFDAGLGFSQGGSLLALIALSPRLAAEAGWTPKFAAIASGYLSDELIGYPSGAIVPPDSELNEESNAADPRVRLNSAIGLSPASSGSSRSLHMFGVNDKVFRLYLWLDISTKRLTLSI